MTDRFQGNGVKFKCKLVGTADVSRERGGGMYLEAIKKVQEQAKELKKGSGKHKQKIILHISLDGIKIVDETTQEVQHEHPISKIPYITPYPDDKNIFGYIYSPFHAECTIFVVKSKQPAVLLTGTLNELFQVKSQLKQQEDNVNFQAELRNCQQQLRLRELQQATTHEQLEEKKQQNENSQIRLREMEQHVTRMEQQLREKGDQLERSERLSREREQQLASLQRQRRELQAVSLRQQMKEQSNRVFEQQRMEQRLKEKDTALQRMASRLDILQRQSGEKDAQEENLQGQLREMEQELREKDEQRENLQRQLSEIEQQSRERDEQMEQRLREKDEQEESLRGQLRQLEQQLTNLQGQYREKENETVSLQEQVTTQERELWVKEQRVNELEMTLSTAQQAAQHQRRQVTPDWVISRGEIQLTDKLLGRGGWGSVVEGKYCGCAVAVKKIHDLILSPHNRNLFEREMNIASRCRHPCLLLFIGATHDAEIPLFVTELMESSLRALLEQRPLTETEVSILSLDVSRALSYLHQKRPSPIIHRDISSANVLLWRQDNQWRGKVSDYGTANFMQHTMTIAPGAMIYMAPEAHTSNQTVKVDVYSFGVLLCEMCIQELPDPERRDQQIAMVTNRQFRALIRRCLQQEHAERPNMEDIIGELEEPV